MEIELADVTKLAATVSRNAFQIGLLSGQLGAGPDFLEPMDATDLDLWEGSR